MGASRHGDPPALISDFIEASREKKLDTSEIKCQRLLNLATFVKICSLDEHAAARPECPFHGREKVRVRGHHHAERQSRGGAGGERTVTMIDSFSHFFPKR